MSDLEAAEATLDSTAAEAVLLRAPRSIRPGANGASSFSVFKLLTRDIVEVRATLARWRAAHPQATLAEIERAVDQHLSGYRAAVFGMLRRALVPGGVLFSSFKLGEGEMFRSERMFTNQTADSLRELVETEPGLDLIESWTSNDLRPGREHEQWLNSLCRRDEG